VVAHEALMIPFYVMGLQVLKTTMDNYCSWSKEELNPEVETSYASCIPV
jgi:hypothetical protein